MFKFIANLQLNVPVKELLTIVQYFVKLYNYETWWLAL